MNTDASSFLQAYNGYLAQNSPLPDTILASYDITNCLREADGKAVYIVRSKIDGRPFILKCSPLTENDSLHTEYRLLTELDHPGLPKTISFLVKDGMAYLIREYVSGPTLSQMIEENGPLSEEQAVTVLLSVCSVLSYLHAQNPPVIHRDIKPENIIFTRNQGCVLIDLGTARRFRSDSGTDTVFMGTVTTAAPEQYGYKQTDVRSDIYALGILLLYLMTGSFEVQGRAAIKNRRLSSIVEKCLRFDPEDRLPSVSRLQLQLGRLFPNKKHMRLMTWLSGAAAGLLLGFCLLFAANAMGLVAQASALPSTSPAPEAATPPVPAQTPDTIQAKDGIAFSSPLIEKAVRQELGFDETQPLTQADLDNVTQLLVCGETVYSEWDDLRVYAHDFRLNEESVNEAKGNILSLEDLNYLPNLRQLSLYGQRIMDLTPLAGLHLTRLCLAKNEIMDVSPLKNCTYLTELNLAWNPIEDISPLAGLTHLKKINLSYTQVLDIAPLAALPLTSFEMVWSSLVDYTPIKDMTRLDTLRISRLTKEEAFIFKSLTSLTNLTLYASTIRELSALSPLKNLQNLDLWSSQFERIEGVENFPFLSRITLGHNPIADLTPLKQSRSLEHVDIQLLTIDLSPLAEMSKLTSVSCNPSQLPVLETLLAGKNVSLQAYPE